LIFLGAVSLSVNHLYQLCVDKFLFCKEETAYGVAGCLVGPEMCIRASHIINDLVNHIVA
ncbi:hypothetical protein KCA24_23650, partial [Escherichia coli]|nr:hypothetical protein [Escherichia coli]